MYLSVINLVGGVSLLRSVLLGLGVFLLCLAGIATRPHLELATFWPANAFALGMLVRFPELVRPASWLSIAAGYLLADALTGSDWTVNISLNVCNMAAIATGHRMLSALPARDRALKRTQSFLYFLRAIFVASVVAGTTGMFANPLLFGAPAREGFIFWFTSELMNYAAFLPMILTFPEITKETPKKLKSWVRSFSFVDAKPLIALAICMVLGGIVGGPGALAFAVPALLWCALSYNLFITACLSFTYGVLTLIAVRTGLIWVGADVDWRSLLISSRIGVTLIALAPLVVGSVMVARGELLEQLRHLAERDAMTGLRNRRSFLAEGGEALADEKSLPQPVAVMMLDIDHFKKINDTYGHSVGDRILSDFARILERNIRPQDTVGRMGGEEFAIILPDCTPEEAVSVARRINAVLRESRYRLETGETVTATVSIGVHVDRWERNLERLLSQADQALYRAKRSGRDRFELSLAQIAAIPA